MKCPVLLIHGGQDSLVPVGMMDRLAKAAKGKIETLRIDGAEHNDLFQVGGEAMWKKIEMFVQKSADDAKKD